MWYKLPTLKGYYSSDAQLYQVLCTVERAKKKMSQSKQGGSGNRPSSSTQGTNKPSSRTGARPASARPPAVRQPVNRSGSQASGKRVNQALPPFTTRRYLVIWVGFVVVLLGVILFLLLFNNNSNSANNKGNSAASTSSCVPADAGAGKYMVIETAKGCIAAKLHTEADAKVSKTIENFEQKANSGYFNGLNFHRVEDWVIQGGDPKGDGTGGGTMPSEYNQLPFKTGALGVARGGDPALNNDSQFFFVKKDSDFLNGQYTNFGQAVAGLDVISKIAIGDKITKVTVETK